ncbi:hypothetical protein ACQ9BO_21595 [Flavobacterium sp. P21]|uniref:hypothetical protein n=1 Tax=Flavobacterium sp. P21 TaxID=3423948 RepID=UPI003D6780C6
MKKINFLFIITTFFVSFFCNAQDEASIEKEIMELHKPTKIVHDSISNLMKEVNLKIETEKDSIKKISLLCV